MEESEIIAGLEDLIHDRESFITPDNDKFYGEDNPFRHDKAVLQAAIDELARRAEPGNKPLALFDRITESPEALAKFLRAINIGKIQLDSCFCKSDCGNEDGCPHELQCIVDWLNQPYSHKPEGSEHT